MWCVVADEAIRVEPRLPVHVGCDVVGAEPIRQVLQDAMWGPPRGQLEPSEGWVCGVAINYAVAKEFIPQVPVGHVGHGPVPVAVAAVGISPHTGSVVRVQEVVPAQGAIDFRHPTAVSTQREDRLEQPEQSGVNLPPGSAACGLLNDVIDEEPRGATQSVVEAAMVGILVSAKSFELCQAILEVEPRVPVFIQYVTAKDGKGWKALHIAAFSAARLAGSPPSPYSLQLSL